MCLYLLCSNSYKFDFPNSQISTKPCQRWLVPVFCSSLEVCLLCLIGLQYLLAPVNNNSQLAEWQQRRNVPEWPERASCFQDNIVFSGVISRFPWDASVWVSSSFKERSSMPQVPRYSLVVSGCKKIKFFLLCDSCLWCGMQKKGWFILKAP